MDFLFRHCIKDYDNVSDIKVRSAYGKLAGIMGIILNLLLFAGKIVAGAFSHSVAIIADAFNNLSDASSSVISLAGFKLSEKPADKDHPYGHGRYEYIAGLMVAVVIMAIGLELLKSGIEKIVTPTPIDASVLAFVILGASILIKLFMVYYNLKIGHKINSTVLIATAGDSRNDCIATAAVLISMIISKTTGVNIDGWMGVAVAIYIIISGFMLVKDTLNPILGQAPSDELVESIEETIKSHDGIEGVHDLMIHEYGPGNVYASAHVEADAGIDAVTAHEEIDHIEREVLDKEGVKLTLHYDPVRKDDEAANEIRAFIINSLSEIDERITVHDLRVVDLSSGRKVLFDVAAPYELEMSDDEIASKIAGILKEEYPEYDSLITVDRV